jgi:hypothetical protein
MSEGVFLAPRVAGLDQASCKQIQQSTAFGTVGLVINAKPGRFYKLRVLNKSATVYYVQIHNKVTAPVNTEVPIWEFKLPASVDSTEEWGLNGLYCSAGMGIALSSTPSVLTLAVAADGVMYGLYAGAV